MTKILVDELPVDPEDCPFVEFIFDNDKHRCKLGPRMKRCVLDLHEACEKLEVIEEMK
jgi:hypothetical protein